MHRRDLHSSLARAEAGQKKFLQMLALFLVSQAAVWWLVEHLSWLRMGHHFGGDFICFWEAAQHAKRGAFAAIYDADGWRRTLTANPSTQIPWFAYPPFSLLGLQFLGGMSYDDAVTVWSLAPLPVYMVLILRLARRSERLAVQHQTTAARDLGWKGQAALAAMTLLFLHANLFCGQTGALIAVLFLAAGYFWPRSPMLAGLFIGLIALKPPLGLVLPFALAAAGQWRIFVSAALTVAVLLAASFAWLGADVWADYLHMTQIAGNYFARHSLARLALAPYLSLISVGVPILGATVAQAIVSLVVLGSVMASFRRGIGTGPDGCRNPQFDLCLGLLATGALLTTPYALTYDSPLLALAVIPLFVRAWRGDCDRLECWSLAALVIIPFGQQLIGRWIPFGFGALLFTHAILSRRVLMPDPVETSPQASPEPATV